MRERRESGEVEQRARPVVHLAQAHERDGRVEQRREVLGPHAVVDGRLDAHELEPVIAGDAGEHVQVGRERIGLHEDARAARPRPHGGDGEPVEAHGRGVAHEHLPRLDAEHDLAEQVGRRARIPEPLRPRADEPGSPLLLDDLGERIRRRARQTAERVAVEVEDAVGVHEPVAKRSERVGGVEGAGVLEREVHASILPRASPAARQPRSCPRSSPSGAGPSPRRCASPAASRSRC